MGRAICVGLKLDLCSIRRWVFRPEGCGPDMAWYPNSSRPEASESIAWGEARLCVRHPKKVVAKRPARRRRASGVGDDARSRRNGSSDDQSPPRSPTCTPSVCGFLVAVNPGWRTQSRASPRASYVQAFGLKRTVATWCGVPESCCCRPRLVSELLKAGGL